MVREHFGFPFNLVLLLGPQMQDATIPRYFSQKRIHRYLIVTPLMIIMSSEE